MRTLLLFISKYGHTILCLFSLFICFFYIKKSQYLSQIKDIINQNLEHCFFEKKSLLKFVLLSLFFSSFVILNSLFKFHAQTKLVTCIFFIIVSLISCRKEFQYFFFDKYPHYKTTFITQGCFAWITIPVIFAFIPNLICKFIQISPNAQKLNHLPKTTFYNYFSHCLATIPTVFSEELLICFIFFIFFNLLPCSKYKRAIIGSIIASVYFGLTHIFVWNLQTALTISFLHIGMSLFFLISGDIRAFIVQHIINNWFSMAVITKMPLLIRPSLLLLAFIPVLFITFSNIKYLFREKVEKTNANT